VSFEGTILRAKLRAARYYISHPSDRGDGRVS
jgi:hypothetical protein